MGLSKAALMLMIPLVLTVAVVYVSFSAQDEESSSSASLLLSKEEIVANQLVKQADGQELAEGAEDSSLGLVLSTLKTRYKKMREDLYRMKKMVKGASPRVITVNVRPRGKPGPVGPPGRRGRTGPNGLVGPAGRRGYPGPRGPRGYRGNQGMRGPMGPAGKMGRPGQAGPRGPPGPRGDPGERGPIGTRGNPGAPGASGANGHDGVPGRPGLNGGARGPPGAPGPIGIRGLVGKQGLPGVQGSPGERGNVGLTGPEGPLGHPGPQGSAGIARSLNPYNSINLSAMKSGRLLGGYARRTDVSWPGGAWSLSMWVYVGASAPSGATPFSYEADGESHRLTLTDSCETLYINGEATQTGFKCAPGSWTHVMVTYDGGNQVRTYKDGKQIKQYTANARIAGGGAVVIGQDNDNAHFPQDKALAPGQVAIVQLFPQALPLDQVAKVRSGELRGSILRNFDGYKIAGIANYDTQPNIRRLARGK